MSTDAWKLAFWEVVSDCLVEFHGREPHQAWMEVLIMRAQIENAPAGIDPEMVYHAEAFDLAARIAEGKSEFDAGTDADLSKNRDAYEEIWRRRLAAISEETVIVARARIHPR